MPYLLREGEGKGVALYSCCEDVLLAQAELLALVDQIPKEHEGKPVYGYLDVDPSLSISHFKRAYRGRSADYRRLMAKRDEILRNGWTYPMVEPDDDSLEVE